MKTVLTALLATFSTTLFLLAPAAQAQTAFRIGGAFNDYGKDLAVDAAGNLYLAPYYQGTVDLDPTGGEDLHTAAGDPSDPAIGAAQVDIALVKMSPEGAYEWGISFPSPGADMPHSVRTDADGNLWMIGYMAFALDIDPGPAVQMLDAGPGRNALLASFTPSGALRWGVTLGDAEADPTDALARDDGMDLAFDAEGHVYATGYFNGTIDLDPSDPPGPDDTFTSQNGSRDVWVASYTSDGAYRWGRAYGGSGWDHGHGIRVARDGTVFVTGFFSDVVDFGAPGGALTSAGGWDVFLAAYDADGTARWAHRFGSAAYDDQVRPGAIAIDAQDRVYLSGDFGAAVSFDPAGAVPPLVSAGSGDVFVARYDAGGAHQMSLRMGGAGLDWSHRIAVADPAGESAGGFFVTGEFASAADFDPGPGTQEISAGGTGGATNLFVAGYELDGRYRWARGIGAAVSGPAAISHGTGIALTPSGDVVATGRFHGAADLGLSPGGAPLVLESGGGPDVFVATFPAGGATGTSRQASGRTRGEASGALRLDAAPNPAHLGAGPLTLHLWQAQPGPARIAVYDLLGRRVALVRGLGEGPLPTHAALAWEPGALPAGVYLARLTTPEGTTAQRLTLVR